MTTRRGGTSGRGPDELEAVTWSGQTYQLPPKLSSAEADDYKKKRFFDATVDNIRSGGGSAQDKVQCLESRFAVGQAKRLEAEQALAGLCTTPIPLTPQWLSTPTRLSFSWWRLNCTAGSFNELGLPQRAVQIRKQLHVDSLKICPGLETKI